MRKLIGLISLVAVIIFSSGCGVNKPKIPKAHFTLPKDKTIIYVDNSLDVAKQKRIVKAFVEAFNKLKTFKIEKTPGFLGKTDWFIKPRENRDMNIGGWAKSCMLYNNTSQWYFASYINTFNYKYDKKIRLRKKDIFSYSPVYYPEGRYKAKVVNNGLSAEITGFKNGLEAMNIWFQIKREFDFFDSIGTTKGKLKNDMSAILSKTGTGDDWTNLYLLNSFFLDGEKLEKENRLILEPIILRASMKAMLIQRLKTYNFRVTNDPKKANIIISVQNFAFEDKDNLAHHGKQRLRKILTSGKLNVPDSIKATGEFGQAAAGFTHMGYGNLGGAMAVLGIISMFDTSGLDTVSINMLSIFTQGKNIYNTLTTSRLAIDHRRPFAMVPCMVDSLSYALAGEFLDNSGFSLLQ